MLRRTHDIESTLPADSLLQLQQDMYREAFEDESEGSGGLELNGDCWYAVETSDVSRVVAALWIGTMPDGDLTLFNVFTSAAHRRRGLMSALMHRALACYIALARSGDTWLDTLVLELWQTNDAARRLYMKHGFVQDYDFMCENVKYREMRPATRMRLNLRGS